MVSTGCISLTGVTPGGGQSLFYSPSTVFFVDGNNWNSTAAERGGFRGRGGRGEP